MSENNNSAENSKRRFEVCRDLARFYFDQWNRRRDDEWKIALGFLGLIAAAVSIPFSLNLSGPPPSTVLGLAILGWIIYSIWIIAIHRVNHQDKTRMDYWTREAAAERKLGINSEDANAVETQILSFIKLNSDHG